MNNLLAFSLLLLALLLIQCKPEVIPPIGNEIIVADSVQRNPFGLAPLTALISVETSLDTRVELRVPGQHGPTSDLVQAFAPLQQQHEIEVLGLYPLTNNQVELTFRDEAGEIVGKETYAILIGELPGAMPEIRIDQSSPNQAPGMTLVSYFGHDGSLRPQRPFFFDESGDIRWYMDFTADPELDFLFFDVGMERLENGNFYFGDVNSNRIYEFSMMGERINQWDMPGYIFHHNVIEKPNGNFVASVSKEGAATVEDYLIELDRSSGDIIREWNLNESLDYGRRTLTADDVDWVHVNAVIFDERDNSLIVSGRTQGLIKLDENNGVVWIMGNHQGWGTNGRGEELNQFLLQPLDATGNLITDQSVLDGLSNAPDFEWNWYQHAPLVTPEGYVMLFDNGDNRNFDNVEPYSRAVAFDIDEANRTIRQVWTYGKDRGRETYARIVSDVDFQEAEQHVIFSPGSVTANAISYGKVIEIDYTSQAVLFEATILPPIAPFGITFHRTERLSLYP